MNILNILKFGEINKELSEEFVRLIVYYVDVYNQR